MLMPKRCVSDEEIDARWNSALQYLLESGYSTIDYVDELKPPHNYREALDRDDCDLLLRAVVVQMAEMAMDVKDPAVIKEIVVETLLDMSDQLCRMATAMCECVPEEGMVEDV